MYWGTCWRTTGVAADGTGLLVRLTTGDAWLDLVGAGDATGVVVGFFRALRTVSSGDGVSNANGPLEAPETLKDVRTAETPQPR